jgi:hypothetical protein
MSSDRDLTRIVRSWLKEDAYEDADRVLDLVLDQLDATPQRRAWWPARRFPLMNNTVRIALAVAAVVVVALIGYQFLRTPNLGDSEPSPTPSMSPTPSPTQTPAAHVPPAGPLAIGRHALTLAGVQLSLEVKTDGWVSNGEFGMDKGTLDSPDSAAFIFWPPSAPDNVYANPCLRTPLTPPAGSSPAELATAVSTVLGIELVSGPSAVSVGGHPAQHVVIRVPESIGCAPQEFYLWYDADTPGNARYATAVNSTIYVWIIDVNGTLVWIDGETNNVTGPEAEQEVQQIIDSIQFE